MRQQIQPPQQSPAPPLWNAVNTTFRHKAGKGAKPSKPDDTVDYRWCVAERWKLIVPRAENAAPQLFDLLADPHERNDLAGERADRAKELRAKIDDWWSPIVTPVLAQRFLRCTHVDGNHIGLHETVFSTHRDAMFRRMRWLR